MISVYSVFLPILLLAQPTDLGGKVALPEQAANAGQACLAILSGTEFDGTPLTKQGWQLNSLPDWYPSANHPAAYAKSGYDVILTPPTPQLFKMLKMCVIEAKITEKTSFARTAANIAEQSNAKPINPAVAKMIGVSKNEFFFENSDFLFAITKRKVGITPIAHIILKAKAK